MYKTMEGSISAFTETLTAFLTQIDSTSQSLSESVQRRPIPLDSATSSFLRRLDAQVSAAAVDVECLESMAFGTVSFPELLGHLEEVYKKNEGYISEVEERLKSFGYVPELEDGGEAFEVDADIANVGSGSEVACGLGSPAGSTRNVVEEDYLFDESMSLQNLGLSDACLATLASEDRDYCTSPDPFTRSLSSGKCLEKETHSSEDISKDKEKWPSLLDAFCEREQATGDVIQISRDDYDKVPSYMKSLASWEDTLEAIDKINSELRNRQGVQKECSFNSDDVEKFGLGRKGRSYLLLLIKMNKLVVETEGGCVIYRVVDA